MAVGVCCSAMGLIYAHWINQRMDIPLRETPEAMKKLEELAQRDISELPSLGLSLLPILLPVALISGVTIYKSGLDPTQPVDPILNLLGDKNIALTIAAGLAMLLAAARLKDRQTVADHVQQAMLEGGLIIVICCAGGAFGAMLQQSGIGPHISSMMGKEPLDFGLLPLAFVVTAIIRGAQKFYYIPAEPKILEIWRGLRPCTPDGLPAIGPAPASRAANLILASGHAMLGLTLAPGTAMLVADMIEHKPPWMDMTPFSPARF